MILESAKRSAPFFEERRAKVRAEIVKLGLDGILITHLVNVRYLSGFTGSSAIVLITPEGAEFLTDFRYVTQAQEQVIGPAIIEYKEPLGVLADLATRKKIRRLGFEAGHVSVARIKEVKARLQSVNLIETVNITETIRIVKDEPEIEAIKALLVMLEKAFPKALGLIRPGVKERDVAVELEYELRTLGADGPAFDFIVASGHRSAIPHGVASEKVISTGEMVTLDWGAKGWGYHSDNTRTLACGNVSGELEKIYSIVLEANLRALEFVKPGVTVKEIDDVARDLIKKSGYEKAFGHGVGHGVGLDIHEKPTVSWREDTKVVQGMVFTIEPGIYLPGKGGVRIEDMVHVTDAGCEVLSARLPKDLLIL